jgi:hypothetical protein
MLLSSVLVLTTQHHHYFRQSIGTDAYVMPSSMPMHRSTRRFRSSETRLHEVNGIAVQDNMHSSFHNVGYDANSIINFYDRRPWEIGLRLNMLGLPLLGKVTIH